MYNGYINVLMPRESEYIEEILDGEDSLEKNESKMKLVLTRRVSNNIVRYVYYLGSEIYIVGAQIYLLLGLRYPLLGLRYTHC